MKRILYVGEFPPPYGGVTLKNVFIKENIFFDMDVSYANLVKCKRNPLFLFLVMFSLVIAVMKKREIIIGVGTQERIHRLLSMIEFLGGSGALGRTTIFVMASTLSEYCQNNKTILPKLRKCKTLYLELETMVKEMSPFDLSNCRVFPNCRSSYQAMCPHGLHTPLKLLFFSRVHRDKGVPIIFSALQELDCLGVDYQLDFYGEIDGEYQEEFLYQLKKYVRVCYCGIFDSEKENIYQKINEYDLFILPTTWMGEGCCGAIVESKMAGIPAIVSDWHYNRELVREGEGIVLRDLTAGCLAAAIYELQQNPTRYEQLAQGAFQSKSRYDFDTYREDIRKAFVNF